MIGTDWKLVQLCPGTNSIFIFTPPWHIRLKARVDRADQIARIYTQNTLKYVKMVVLITLKI